ncbi:hypothetical protein DBT_0218 [Dissulfuribacter thermophilus]|uniref:Uncharacterized protein n=1 Tax=Dissulfuribacter thermophilus TaxID=1156395 RepID=A0A1B9F9E7_9BACT|nr:hypothetical protein DBT_0218 [Dissulfuribacter thermophilus]
MPVPKPETGGRRRYKKFKVQSSLPSTQNSKLNTSEMLNTFIRGVTNSFVMKVWD